MSDEEGFIELNDEADAQLAEESHPVLSAEDVALAKQMARDKLNKERHASAMKAIQAAEEARLRREEGLVTGDGAKDEMVRITLDLASHSSNVTINGFPYWHGFTYTVPRHVADTLREVQSRGWKHQDEVDGKTIAQNLQANRRANISKVIAPRDVVLNARTGGVANAPQPFDAERLRA